MDNISAVCTGLCMNSSFCSFVDLFVDPGLEDLRCSDVDSLGIESTDNSNSSVSGLGGGGAAPYSSLDLCRCSGIAICLSNTWTCSPPACTGLCMNSSFCSFVDLFVDPGLEDLRCSDVDSLGIESTDNSNSSVSGLGGGGSSLFLAGLVQV